jgi:MFS family permease
LIEPIYAAFVMEQVPAHRRSMLAGLYSVTWSVGFSVGPTVAGWLQSNVNLAASFVFGASCLVLCPSLLLIFFGRRKLSV